MAVAVYSTDLATLNLGTGTWVELDGAASGSAPTENDVDNFIAGTDSTTEAVRNSGLSSMSAPANTTTITSGDAVFMWLYFSAMASMDDFSNGGYRVAIGNADSDYKMWNMFGYDTKPLGGWISVAVDPAQTASSSYGTPTSVTTYFGSVINLTGGISKGNAFANDYQRHGRSLIVTAGDATTPANFADAAQENDYNDATNGYHRWGLFTATDAGYSGKGLFQTGSATTAAYFEDENVNIVIEDTFHCAAGFNEFEVLNTGTTVDWTGINITALGTQARCNYTVTDNAIVGHTGCTFTDMGLFVYQSNSTLTNTIYRRTKQVTQDGATVDTCIFDSITDATSLVVDSLADVTDCHFYSDGSNYAVDLGTYSANASVNWNNYATDYASTNGSTGNEVIKVNVGTGYTLTVNVGAGYDTPTYHNAGSGTVTIVNAVTVKVTVKDAIAGTLITGARVYLYADTGGDLTEGTVILNDVTTATGIIQDTGFAFTNDQPVLGRVRKGSATPFYKTGAITGTITANGFEATVLMISDE